MKCFSHNEIDAVGLCIKCGKGVCRQCATEDTDKKNLCKICAAESKIVEIIPGPNVVASPIRPYVNKPRNSIAANLSLLAIALVIDFVDALPLDLSLAMSMSSH